MKPNDHIAALRREYSLHSLDETAVTPDPVDQFRSWWDEAMESKVEEANAMTIATCDAAGNPSARIVLLKGISDDGFLFYTNYESRKAKQLADNPRACLVFFWRELERQVRVEGTVSKVAEDVSDAYFASRPFTSRVSAVSSPQSTVVNGRSVLEEKVREIQSQYPDGHIPRPANWGGYAVKPVLIEFWQGRESRLHDRVQYSLREGGWIIERLAP